jgi:hypothetical protein
MELLSDAAVICTFMEPKPKDRPGAFGANEYWWRWGWRYVGPSIPQQETPVEYCWLPRNLTLDALWEVEERLKAHPAYLWIHYASGQFPLDRWTCLHATPKQKIEALAKVLRLLVEREEGETK